MNYDVCVVGTKDTTIQVAKYIHKNIKKISCIITIDENSVDTQSISGFSPIDTFAMENNISLFKAKSYSLTNDESRSFFANNTFGLGICMGWQRLIPEYVLEKFVHGIFGFHGSCGYLPFGKGRSPLNWSLINGDERFILNLFKYDKYADSPNVFMNKMFQISKFDTIRTLQYKNLLCSYSMIKELVKAIDDENLYVHSESKDFETFYPKRTPDDGKISFTSRTQEIYNLIRGVTKPFPGAFAYVNKLSSYIIKIWSAIPFENIMDFSNYQVGEIIEIFDGNLVVRTVDGSILISDFECDEELCMGDVLY